LAEETQRNAEEAARKKLYSIGGQQSRIGLKTGGGFALGNFPVGYDLSKSSITSSTSVSNDHATQAEFCESDEYLIGDPDSPDLAFRPGSAVQRSTAKSTPQRVNLPQYEINGAVSDLPQSTALSQAT